MEHVKNISARLTQLIQEGQLTQLTNRSSSTTLETCPKCHGERWIEVIVEGAKKLAPCECQISTRVNARLRYQYRKASMADLKPAVANTICEWVRSGKPGLFIHGPAGTGKTYMAAAVTRSLLMIYQDAKLVEMAEIYRRVRSSFNSDVPEDAIISEYLEIPWLTLDDFGAGALSDFERRYAAELLNGRINRGRPTIVTSNLELDEIRDKMDERISSRLLLFADIKLTGRDRRATP
jgi:DNA replication protein DnaC